MKAFFIALFTIFTFPSFGQGIDVELLITYSGKPLCYWDITIKQGDVSLASGTTNQEGKVLYSNVPLAYSTIDIYGHKNTSNGSKDWNVRGYVDVDQQGKAHLNLNDIVKEVGVSMATLESAWGLSSSDCGGASATSAASTTSTTSSQVAQSEQNTETESSESDKEDEAYITSKEDDSDENEAPKVTLMTPQESLEGQRAVHENKIAKATSKIAKLERDLDKEEENSKESNDLKYEIRYQEIERGIAQAKLDKVNLSISKNYQPLTRSEKAPYNDKIDALSDEYKTLKEKQKDNIVYGGTEKLKNMTSVELYTQEDLDQKSTVALKKEKLDYNTLLGKRKLKLKTKSAFLSPEEKSNLEKEIDLINQQIDIIQKELDKRSDEKEAEKE